MHAFCHTHVENPLKGPDYEEQILYSVCENHLLKIMKEISLEILQGRNFGKKSMLNYF